MGCKRKGRREGAKFPQREFARDGSLKLQRSIATSRQRTGQDDRLAAAGVYLLTRCVVPAKAGNSRFETGFLVRARVALRNARARREKWIFSCVSVWYYSARRCCSSI